MHRTHLLTSTSIFLLISLSYLLMACNYPVAYIAATYEDFFGEWAQFFLFTILFVLAARLSCIKSPFRVFFIVLALTGFYTCMEEISWGQRIFNLPVPDFFMRHNLQRETNIHNFIVGPYATTLKRAIEYTLFSGIVLYGVVYPLVHSRQTQLACWVEAKGLPSPPLYLWPFFLLSAVLELGLFNFNEAEVAEILLPLALSIMLLHFLVLSKGKGHFDRNVMPPHSPAQSRRLAAAIIVLFLFVVSAAAGVTYAHYSSSRLQERMKNKLYNGMEKFAYRYSQYGMWRNAILLYTLVDDQEPDRPSIQRQLAYCYKQSGGPEEEEMYLERALEIDQEKLAALPESISAHLSIARTYDQIGMIEKARNHEERALNIGRERVKAKPGSANAAYWLGKVYAQKGDSVTALKHFERAFELQPERKKYRGAYMKTRIQIGNSADSMDDESDEKE